ncbi:hypothetical protein A5722_31280 [Mycobacterium vulneris]|uniref:Uncharacterized protein n=1 Tax=Mycolicibacterium septicum DSM 44393 TaxID=1341646 RepID=A0A7X6RZV7_9MYCO|nr:MULTISPECIES: hypothetical protein [Mycolicibacterium]MBX8687871.1 hypothetical protein [Mycobacterium sp. 20091114027_K0903767]MCP3811024.1 hypothetical protein [Mycobacteriaceae bacterium Msp059]OCB48686.1 hypothetical protein A5721_04895 [Mycolicibacterium vulneris]NKZ15036.1 hypothetical protein [Mycolicibacterium septicum DSM 44393]OBK01655.1 hypothetical protein A5637_18825 [Mycolicibacterium fortuitum]
MTSDTTDPWSPAPRAIEHHDEALPDTEVFADYAAATNTYAGPFCFCGDYFCPANNNPTARCVNSEDSFSYTSRYPESWTDDDIDAYEAQELLDSLVSEAHYEAHNDTLLAVERVNTLGAAQDSNPSPATRSLARTA